MNDFEQYIAAMRAAYDPEYTDIDFDSATVAEQHLMLRGVEPPPKYNDDFDQFCF